MLTVLQANEKECIKVYTIYFFKSKLIQQMKGISFVRNCDLDFNIISQTLLHWILHHHMSGKPATLEDASDINISTANKLISQTAASTWCYLIAARGLKSKCKNEVAKNRDYAILECVIVCMECSLAYNCYGAWLGCQIFILYFD